MTDRLRTALVGCGKVGDTHAMALQTLSQSDFVAVFDVDKNRADAFAARYGATGYDNLEKMIDDAGVQTISICTPHPTHADVIVRAAAKGVHALVEKPLASALADADRAINAARAAGVKLGVVSQRRLYPCVARMHNAIRDGKIGMPILGTLVVMGWRDEAYYQSDPWRGSWDAEGGGVLVNQTPHQLDMLQWLMDSELDELFGYWDNFNHPYVEIEDTAIAVVRFKSGGLGQILVSNSQKPGLWGKMHVHGSSGASVGAQTEGGSPFVSGQTDAVEPPINDVWTIPGEEEMLEVWQEEDTAFCEEHNPMTYYHRLQIEDFLNAVLEDREPMVNGEEGRKVVEMFTAIYRSQRDNRPVKFPLQPETGRDDYDGRKSCVPVSRR